MTTISKFANLSSQEKRTKIEEKDPKNTRKANDRAVKLFHTYLIERGKDKKIESMTEEELNKYLSDFYFEVRKGNGELYKSNTFDSVRYALQKAVTLCLGKETWDIVRAPAFQKANISFKAAKAELKRMGKGDTQ